ncbi:MAG TPA: acyl-ACP desaturase [Acidimicrobiales bacterium]|jgi:acyl-[acyl-carrier-protein] desaturase|nr:acyl-ACP desaturase [Acidimicrobiales bacterium]
MDDARLLHELEPTVESLVERHYSKTKEWFPHRLVPWSRARDFDDEEIWVVPDDAPPAPVRSALFVNLLTEDNLPYYSMEIHRAFGGDGAWGEWARRWTAEEGRHSIVIRDYLTVTRALDPVELERARMAQVSGGIVPHPVSAMRGMIYVTMQELATVISHLNTGKLLTDPAGYEVMKRVSVDENFHYLFYRDITSAAIELDPSGFVLALEPEVVGFAMPGVGIPNFDQHAKVIANAGVYDFALHHDKILQPVVLRHWKLEELTGLTDEAEQARERILKYITRLGKVATRLKNKRAREAEEAKQLEAV